MIFALFATHPAMAAMTAMDLRQSA